MKKLVIIGHSSNDFVINYDNEIRNITSGAAYLAAVGASNFCKDVGIVTRIGKDFQLSKLEKLNIDLEGVKKNPNLLSSKFVLVYLSPDHSKRDFLGYLNVGEDLCPDDIPEEYYHSEYVFITTMPPLQQRLFIDFYRKHSPNTKLAIDSLEQYIESYKDLVWSNFMDCDLCFVDRQELDLIKEIQSQNQTSIVIKRGKLGAQYISSEHNISVSAPYVSSITDKTGSGDVLGGAFLAQIVEGVNPYLALEQSSFIASESIKDFGVEHIYNFIKDRK